MSMPHDVCRILDANANRAAEGLRVVEEFARFVLQDRHLTDCLKTLRHHLAAAVTNLGASNLLACRDTLRDVGVEVTTDQEFQREDVAAVWMANQKRVEQSLRCLEEYSKTVSADAAAKFERLRYRAYTLAKALETTHRSCRELTKARLYVLIDGRETELAFERLATDLIQAGVHLLQLRDKNLCDRELLQRARCLRRCTRGTETIFIMNDRPDLALLSDADGVHVGQEELSVSDARRIVGPSRMVGVSTHSLEQARQAVLDGADYIGCGPTFPSQTKNFPDFPGLSFLADVAQEIALPAFAIGGINLQNAHGVVSTGFRRIAISGAILNAESPAAAVQEFLTLLRTAN